MDGEINLCSVMPCDVCGEVFASKLALQAHEEYRHSAVNELTAALLAYNRKDNDVRDLYRAQMDIEVSYQKLGHETDIRLLGL